MDLNWEHALLAAASIVAAIGVLWRGLIRPLLIALERAKVLAAIAEQFTPNGGTSLRDAIDRIEEKADESLAIAKELKERDGK